MACIDSHAVLQYWSLPLGPDLGPVLEFLFQNHALPFQGIAVALGPGNFSATRIGLSFAQGLAMAHKVPLLGYSSLEGYLSPGDQGKALMLPLGKRGGVLTLSSDLSEDGFVQKKKGVGPGTLLSYSEASEHCLVHGYYHVISPNPQLFIKSFSKKISIEKVSPSIEKIRQYIISQYIYLECNKQLLPDYRSYSCFF
ncbi:TsaB protein [Candidatus Chlamydia sanziniae]|uniref:N(6)-L-threonylcarbamoyladenine synthase n=1 Tax=Candidatus Chlamydia sanziniae TaxID=1806891 RepID=A0A1A9HUX5_9CHLA|nr:TsaB protein [Candidatus Chlamydia sanziniae]